MRVTYASGILLFATFVLGLSAVSFVQPATATGKPAQVILIRHAEKPPTGEELSPRGLERAAALAPFFLHRDEVLHFGTPVAIYGERPKKSRSSVRPLDTVQPLANALGLPLNDKFTRLEYQPLADEILSQPQYAGKMVLVCWEHSVIPQLAKALGATTPDQWSGKAFDRLWIITYQTDGQVAFQDLPQRLLFGDSKD